MTTAKRCVDCVKEGITTKRKATPPGPRCSTHARARRTLTRNSAWERRLLALYALTAEEYRAVLSAQGNACFICQRAKGTGKRRLAVDHDHSTGYVRSILCSTCNKMLGHARDDIEVFQRAIQCLLFPPAWRVIGQRLAPIEAQRLTLNGDL